VDWHLHCTEIKTQLHQYRVHSLSSLHCNELDISPRFEEPLKLC